LTDLATISARSDEATGAGAISTFGEMLDFLRRAYPERGAVTLYEREDQSVSATYGELHERASRVAGPLVAHGLPPGARVLVFLLRSVAFIDASVGALLAGGVPAPVSPPHSLSGLELEEYGETLRRIASDAQPAACVTTARLLWVLRGVLTEAAPEIRLVDA